MRAYLWRALLLVALLSILLVAVFWLAKQFSSAWELGDFTVTFYRTARYFLRGENVYINSYPHPFNGREYPPYAPIWSLLVFIPFGTWSLPEAEALRVMLDIAFLPFLAYLSVRWAGLRGIIPGVLLALAPWLLTQLNSGQLTPLVFLGIFLSYWGVRKPSAPMVGVGLWFLLAKPNIVSLVVLATLIFAWRSKILVRSLAILVCLVAIASVAEPLWWVDLLGLYVDRLAHPRLADSILLLPGYPWPQLVLLTAVAIFTIWYVWRFSLVRPGPWLWAVLTVASLVGAIHSFIYDWQLLMLPMALLLRTRWGTVLTLMVYMYSLLWVILPTNVDILIPSVVMIPALVMLATYISWIIAARATNHQLATISVEV